MPAIYTSGNEIVLALIVLDQSNDPLTGLTAGSGAGGFTNADFTVTLSRQSGTSYVTATETVVLAEGTPAGTYAIRFTPQNTGTYLLHVKELDAATNGYTHDRFLEVVTAGTVFVPSLAECFCSESDIERYWLRDLTSSTKPSSTQAAGYAEERAAELMSLCARLGYPQTPSTVASGSFLQDLLRKANAVGAALDCVYAAAFGVSPSRTDQGIDLLAEWYRMVGRYNDSGKWVPGMIEREITGNQVSLSTDHILSGDTIAATPTYPTDIGIPVSMRDTF